MQIEPVCRNHNCNLNLLYIAEFLYLHIMILFGLNPSELNHIYTFYMLYHVSVVKMMEVFELSSIIFLKIDNLEISPTTVHEI